MDHLMRLEAERINNIFAHDLNSSWNIGFFFHVDFHVLLEASLHSKALAAVDADVRVEVLVNLKMLVKICYAAKNLSTLVALQPMGLMYDHTILRLYCQLSAVIGLHFDHMLAFCLEQDFSQQGFISRCLDLCSCKTVHFTVLHLNVIMVCLGYDCIYTGYCTEL